MSGLSRLALVVLLSSNLAFRIDDGVTRYDVGETIEFNRDLNSRTSASFYSRDNNHAGLITKGTHGRVVKHKIFASGDPNNEAYQIIVTSPEDSPLLGQRVWVYNKPKENWVKLYQNETNTKDASVTRLQTYLETLRDQNGIPDEELVKDQLAGFPVFAGLINEALTGGSDGSAENAQFCALDDMGPELPLEMRKPAGGEAEQLELIEIAPFTQARLALEGKESTMSVDEALDRLSKVQIKSDLNRSLIRTALGRLAVQRDLTKAQLRKVAIIEENIARAPTSYTDLWVNIAMVDIESQGVDPKAYSRSLRSLRNVSAIADIRTQPASNASWKALQLMKDRCIEKIGNSTDNAFCRELTRARVAMVKGMGKSEDKANALYRLEQILNNAEKEDPTIVAAAEDEMRSIALRLACDNQEKYGNAISNWTVNKEVEAPVVAVTDAAVSSDSDDATVAE